MTDDLVKRANYALNDMQGKVEAGKLAVFEECIARIEELEDKLRSMALDCMAADGQAMEAHQAQLAAEAKLAKAVWAIEIMQDASDAMMLYIARTTLAELEQKP
jgi:accessory colonization factor AcfC